MSSVRIALLRGVNVGGHNKLPMKELVALVEELGGRDVRTYIQSGNVVFGAAGELTEDAAGTLGRAIERRFDVRTPVILRTPEALRTIVDGNPFLRNAEQDPKELHVAFLADKPTAEAVATLDPERSPGDEFVVVGSEIYTRCPKLASTKLSNAYFDSKLKTISTMRNWRTTLALLRLAEA